MLNKKISPIYIHVIVWVIVAMLHYVISDYNSEDSIEEGANLFMWVIPFSMLVIRFYINYLWLVDSYFFKRRYASFLAFNTLFWFITLCVARVMKSGIIDSDNILTIIAPRGFTPVFYAHLVILFISQVAPALGVKIAEKWYTEQQRLRNIEKAQTDMELQNLRSQLNPHFLFNALNSVYAQIAFEPKNAQASLLDICDLLRYQLYDVDTAVVPLEKEIKFIENYCRLMELRLSPNTELKVSLPTESQGVKVAPLLFIALIENAFKHGIDSKKESSINIKISTMGDTISCTVQNTNYPKSKSDNSGSGIGLVNLQRRLNLIYPHSHNYNAKVAGDKYIATLIINTLEI